MLRFIKETSECLWMMIFPLDGSINATEGIAKHYHLIVKCFDVNKEYSRKVKQFRPNYLSKITSNNTDWRFDLYSEVLLVYSGGATGGGGGAGGQFMIFDLFFVLFLFCFVFCLSAQRSVIAMIIPLPRDEYFWWKIFEVEKKNVSGSPPPPPPPPSPRWATFSGLAPKFWERAASETFPPPPPPPHPPLSKHPCAAPAGIPSVKSMIFNEMWRGTRTGIQQADYNYHDLTC